MRVEMKLPPRVLALSVFLVAMLPLGYEVYQVDKARREVWSLKPTPSAPTVRQLRPEGTLTLGQLGKLHLMGKVKVPKPPRQTPAASADANLKLELVGTIRGGPDGRDSAFITAVGRESKRYYVGDAVEGVALLMKVEADQVVLKRGESLETLKYMSGEGGGAAAARPAPVSVPVTADNSVQQSQNTSESQAPTPNKPLSARERLRMRQRLQQQPASAGD